MSKNLLLRAAKMLVTGVLLAYVLNKAGLFDESGRQELFGMFSSMDWRFVALSLLVSLLLNFTSAFKWHVLVSSRNVDVRLLRLFAYYYIGRFFNLFLPTNMGGDVVRMYKLAKKTGNSKESVASVFMERFTGMITLMVLAAIAFVVSYRTYNMPRITFSFLIMTTALAIIGWLILDTRPFNFVRRLLLGRIKLLDKVLDKLSEVQHAVISYRHNKGVLWKAFGISVVFYFLAIVNVWVSGRALSPEIQFVSMVIAVPAIMLIMNIPISVGGIGLMEFAYTVVFEIFGYSALLALSTALLIRFKTLLDATAGGLLYLVDKDRRDTRSQQ